MMIFLLLLAGQDLFHQATTPQSRKADPGFTFPDNVPLNDDSRLNQGDNFLENLTPRHKNYLLPSSVKFSEKDIKELEQTNLCRGNDFCENPDVYPLKIVDTIIQKILNREGASNSLVTLLNEDDTEVRSSSRLTNKFFTSIRGAQSRVKSDQLKPSSSLDSLLYDEENDGEISACASLVRYIRPKRGKTKDNKFKFVVNSLSEKSNSLVQTVRIEKCYNPGGECTFGQGFTLEDYGIKTICRQKYTFRRLIAVNETGEEIVDSFQFPTCCVCKVINKLIPPGSK